MAKTITGKIKFAIRKFRLRKRVKIHHHSFIVNTYFDGTAVIEPYSRIIGASNITIGDNFYCNCNCHLLGNITIGKDVQFGPKVIIWSRNHGIRSGVKISKQDSIDRPVTIGDDVWIGAAAIVLSGVSVGNGAVIGAGAVVTRDIPENSVAVGNPAKVIKQRS